jgi:hypothetical protein
MFKKFWEKYGNLVLMAALAVFIIFHIDGCNKDNAKDQRIADLLSYEHTVKEFLAEDGTTVNYNTNLEVAVEDLIATQDTLLDYIANLQLKIKDVHSSTIITERLRVDSIPIPVFLTDCEFDTTVVIDSTHYNMDITMTNRGLMFNTLEFPNRQGVTISERRKDGKWWKRKETILAVTNSNPYIQTDGITSYTFQQKGGFFSKRWVQLTGGAIIGIVGTYLIMK